MSTAARKARKRAGIAFTRTPKTPTPVLNRSHTWLHRKVKPKKVGGVMLPETRPSRIGVARYGIRDLGWQAEGKYVTKAGRLTKAATAS